MKNNNQPIVRKLIKRSLGANKKRNIFILMAIVLTTILLASTFSVGLSFAETLKFQQIRLMGTLAHVGITKPTADEIEKLESLDYVKTVTTGNAVGNVISQSGYSDLILTLYCYDKAEWTEMRSPTLTNINGKYPEKENEIMIPLWVLERLKIEPKIGAEVSLEYLIYEGNEQVLYSENFVLSGWYESYSHIRVGNMDSLLVSKSFAEKYNKTPENSGAAFVIYKDSVLVGQYSERLLKDLNIDEASSERVRTVPMYQTLNSGQSSFVAVAIIIVFIVFTGYLLIYNVMYISVARDVRFYGMLKTIGTTPKQIRRIVRGQTLLLCFFAIPVGLIISAALSLVVVPAIMGLGSMETGAVVSFSPIIYIGAALFAVLTAFLGASKPAKKAASVSPIEAQKYSGATYNKKGVRFSAKGKPIRMALRNIFRDRKRSIVVLLSLFLGVTTFTSATTLIKSMDADNFVEMYMNYDFVLQNTTKSFGSEVDAKQVFDDDFLSQISQIEGVESVIYDSESFINIVYNDKYFPYVKDELETYYSEFSENGKAIYDSEGNLSNEVKDNIERSFASIVIGIDSKALNELDNVNEIDVEAFERGEIILLASKDNNLLDNVDEVKFKNDDGEVSKTVVVGGKAPYFFHGNGHSMGPNIIVSQKLMEELLGENPIRNKVMFNVEKGTDQKVLDKLNLLMSDNFEMSRESKIEMLEDMKNTKFVLYILGGCIALVFGFIGVMNFINVMSVGVVVRKKEFATMESIGMSRKQLRLMLLLEGLGYGVITLLMVITLGNAISYGLFELFRQQATYAVFTYPFVPVVISALVILIVCIVTPELAYRSVNKSTIVERLKEAD